MSRLHPTPVSTRSDSHRSERELLLADDVAALLEMGTDWVYEQTRKGRIPHIRLGRSVRYRRMAILAWLERIEDGGR